VPAALLACFIRMPGTLETPPDGKSAADEHDLDRMARRQVGSLFAGERPRSWRCAARESRHRPAPRPRRLPRFRDTVSVRQMAEPTSACLRIVRILLIENDALSHCSASGRCVGRRGAWRDCRLAGGSTAPGILMRFDGVDTVGSDCHLTGVTSAMTNRAPTRASTTPTDCRPGQRAAAARAGILTTARPAPFFFGFRSLFAHCQWRHANARRDRLGLIVDAGSSMRRTGASAACRLGRVHPEC